MIASEAAPFAKTGGLGDVLGALPAAMSRAGWDATVVLPRYRGNTAGREIDRFPLRVGGYSTEVGIFEAPLADGARALLVDDPRMFDREFIYGEGAGDYPDSPLRFAVLARAALEHAVRGNIPVTVVHAHDWQGGLVPVYLKTLYSGHPVLSRAGVVFTIHNLAYQGWVDPDWLPQLDLPWHLYSIDQLEFYGRISLLKGGVVNAGMVTTVSPQYAREIQTPSGGVGFDGILRSRGDRLVGILNGIDAVEWDPMADRFLPAPYSADDVSGKRVAKKALLERYGLASDDAAMARPLIGMVTRMVDQKGLNLIEQLAGELPWLDAGFAVLGTGESRYQDMWRDLASQHPWKIGVRIGFDEGLAHLIEAGSDLFLMPSLFEPCGLNQMYSLRYGTVPLVRRVGGLADTVTNFDPSRGDSTGFVFDDFTPWALIGTLRWALDTYRDKDAWHRLQVNGMRQDLSWDRSAREYVKIYESAVSRGTL